MIPVLFMVLTSVKSDEQYSDDVLGLPWPLEFGNFSAALKGGEFVTWFKNSVILTGGAVIVSTLVAALAAFAIANMRFRGRELLLSANVALMVVPPVVMLIPLFIQFTELGLVSTYRGVILIYAGLTAPFSVYLLASFFRTLPHELFESATIDGAGPLPDPVVDRAAAGAAGAGDADHRQLAVGLERAAGRAGVPARRAAEDADGGRHAVPGPLLAERPGADGRDAGRVGAHGGCCTWRASATSSAA